MKHPLILLALSLAGAATAAPPPAAKPATARAAIVTSEGTIVVEVDLRHAPITAGNFMRYVDAHKLEGTTFYRAARSKSRPGDGLIQGGVDHDLTRTFLPIAHEPTSKTGIHHVNGTISMARNEVGSAMGDFFIILGDGRALDAAPHYPGYAAFGHVVKGMDVAHRILAKPTYPGGRSIETFGQTLRQPVKIIATKRLP